MRSIRRLAPAGALVASLALAPAVSAQTVDGSQTAVATATSSLALSVPSLVTAGLLTPGQTTTFTPTAIAVVAPNGNWGLTVSDATNGGKLAAAAVGCAGSDAQLTNSLSYSASAAIGNKSGTGVVGTAASSVVGSVTSLSDTVNVTYSVGVPAAQQLKAGCVYSTTLAYTLTG